VIYLVVISTSKSLVCRCQDAVSDKLQFSARAESSLDTARKSDSEEVDGKGGIERGTGRGG